jgi:hypothetical protein
VAWRSTTRLGASCLPVCARLESIKSRLNGMPPKFDLSGRIPLSPVQAGANCTEWIEQHRAREPLARAFSRARASRHRIRLEHARPPGSSPPASTFTRVYPRASLMACRPSLRPPLAGDVAYGCTTPAPPTSTQRASPAANAQGHKPKLP